MLAIWTRAVVAPMAVISVQASGYGSRTPGRVSKKKWSGTQTESNPARSARWA